MLVILLVFGIYKHFTGLAIITCSSFRCADSPKPRGKNAPNLFQTLLDLLTPDEIYKSSKDILPHFKEKIGIQNNVICETYVTIILLVCRSLLVVFQHLTPLESSFYCL